MRDLITAKKLSNNCSCPNDKKKNIYADILHGNADF